MLELRVPAFEVLSPPISLMPAKLGSRRQLDPAGGTGQVTQVLAVQARKEVRELGKMTGGWSGRLRSLWDFMVKH